MSVPEDPDKGWLDRWAEAQEVVERWEQRTGRLLPIEQATDLTREISQALQRAYERGKAARA